MIASAQDELPTLATISAAAGVLAGVARVTPVLSDDLLDELVGANVFVKAEFLQRGGSFKFRGMYNKLDSLAVHELERGVVTASSGNAGLALTLAARAKRTTSVVVMPDDASPVKRAAIEAAGGHVLAHGASSDEMLERALEVADRQGRAFVHPFDQPEVIAGQGTAGLELANQLPDFDAVLVPAGGGGLLAGTALALRALRPAVKIFGVEPEGANSIQLSLANGRVTPLSAVSTIAEGLAVRRPGTLTFRLIERHVDGVLTVSDNAIMQAIGVFWNVLHVAVEPSGAAALAVLLSSTEFRGQRVAVVASGANIDPRRLEQGAAATAVGAR